MPVAVTLRSIVSERRHKCNVNFTGSACAMESHDTLKLKNSHWFLISHKSSSGIEQYTVLWTCTIKFSEYSICDQSVWVLLCVSMTMHKAHNSGIKCRQ